ncbi:putative ABC transport system permease protein [Microbacterium resistens]|uniref:ABC transport system permease protein n=1 Tax=Microbacterium resistens TaxID=156977 RepID=A0ABU1S8A5_9MICO|nr:ABC transporter permease [Microbacterium resistens]MDR6865785.1 putative ABC transport system permease protein [Microbacterium resistens]
MLESMRLSLKSVMRRWRRNLVSLIVIAAGVGALVVLSSVSVGSSETVSSRLDSSVSSSVIALLPARAWSLGEATLLANMWESQQVIAAGTLVSPDRTAGSAVITNPRSSQTVESSVGVATPSGLRVASATARSGGIGTDTVVNSLDNAVYLGARLARELNYPGVEAGPVVINGQVFSVLGIVTSDEAWISASIIFPPAAADSAGYRPSNRVLTVSTRGDVSSKFQNWVALALFPADPSTVSVLSPPSARELRAEILERGNSLTGLIGIIATLTAFLTLAATTFASLTERRHEMGLYLALGYGRPFVSGQIVAEGTIVGLLSGLVGLLLGTVVSAIIGMYSFPLFYIPPLLLILPAAAGALGFMSALFPALVATRVAPSELLRD